MIPYSIRPLLLHAAIGLSSSCASAPFLFAYSTFDYLSSMVSSYFFFPFVILFVSVVYYCQYMCLYLLCSELSYYNFVKCVLFFILPSIFFFSPDIQICEDKFNFLYCLVHYYTICLPGADCLDFFPLGW